MKRLLAALFLLSAAPAFAQVSMVGAPCNMTDGSCAGVLSSFVAPPGCVSSSVPFFGAAVTLGCDGGITYDGTTDTLTVGKLSSGPAQATSLKAIAPATITITDATNATPVVVTATAHGLQTGDLVSQSGFTGLTNANGFFSVVRLSADTYSLKNPTTGADVAGNGAYGGTPVATTGIVQAGRVLVGAGTAAQPSLAMVGDTTLGFYKSAAQAWSFVYGGSPYIRFGTANFDLQTDIMAIRFGLNSDAYLTRPAAATLQLGAADVNGSPVAQTLKVQSAITGTNLAPAAWTLQGSLGTGNATPGAINITSGGRSATSGTTAQTAIVRHGIGWSKVLTNNSAIAVVNATLASNTGMGMIVRYLVEVFDGTNLQTESGVVSINGVNKAGAFTIATPTKAGNVQALSSGTLAVTWAASSANPSVISVNANSSLTPSTGYPRITYTIDNLSQQAVAMQ